VSETRCGASLLAARGQIIDARDGTHAKDNPKSDQ
jgi:hypothetical protein